MSDTTISSTSSTTSLAQQLAELKNTNVSSMISALQSSSDGDDLTETLCSLASDQCSLSAVSLSLNSVAKAANKSGASDEAVNNVRLFAASLQEQGYSTVSILKYLGNARDLATSDPDKFNDVFSTDSESTTSSTISSLSSDSESESDSDS